MQSNATAIGTFAKDAAFGPYLRVVMNGAVIGLAGALDREIGTLNRRVLASGVGGDGTDASVVLPTAQGTIKMIANGAVTIFSRVYGAAAGKVSATANGNLIGYALSATAGDGESLEVLRIDDACVLLFDPVAPSTNVGGSAAEVIFDTFATFPANSLRVGDVIEFDGKVTAATGVGTDTLTVRARIGPALLTGQLLANTGALDVAASGDTAPIKGQITIRTLGAGGTMIADGSMSIGTPGTATLKTFDLASTPIDTTVANQLGMTGQWSTTNANVARCDKLNVMIKRL